MVSSFRDVEQNKAKKTRQVKGKIAHYLKVFNVLGMEIMTLVKGEESAGHHEINFDATNMPSGLYLYRVQAGKFNKTKKMLLLK